MMSFAWRWNQIIHRQDANIESKVYVDHFKMWFVERNLNSKTIVIYDSAYFKPSSCKLELLLNFCVWWMSCLHNADIKVEPLDLYRNFKLLHNTSVFKLRVKVQQGCYRKLVWSWSRWRKVWKSQEEKTRYIMAKDKLGWILK